MMAAKLLAEFKAIPGTEAKPLADARGSLTGFELEVLNLVARGLNNREIADKLFISENTVRTMCATCWRAPAGTSRIEAVMYAVRSAPARPP